ncbi:MAG TPA: hypothetical protein VL098_15485 [Flavipsychrobacter sp.]|nr:hypothetical protein [Flavipsychrobacter sp.]
MLKEDGFIEHINAENFDDIALEVFKKQYRENDIYRAYVDALSIDMGAVDSILKIPFLPISFFKTHQVICGDTLPGLYFESSGTTSEVNSKHYIKDAAVYEQSLLKGFEQFYGSPGDYVILALLPSYLERRNASLVHMAEQLMKKSGHAANGFYLNEWDKLSQTILELEAAGQKTILLGVTFALLDFAEQFPMKLRNIIVMETGGMKGRKTEMTREEVHGFLKQQWQLENIQSEYGMTELLSQAYAKAAGVFYPTCSMKLFIRDVNDPLEVNPGGVGGINVIDLANIHSCSFIATEDIGKLEKDGSFKVLGRMDHSALRGCSLMTA